MTAPAPSSDPAGDNLDDRNWGLTCAELLELTTEYLEGALNESDTARFDAHLAICEGCTTVLDQLRRQVTMTGQLHETDIEPDTLDELLDAFADWKNRPTQ